MVSGPPYPRYRSGGRFFGRRVNCERVPQLPAALMRQVLDDPPKVPYLLIWRSPSDGEIKEAVRVRRYRPPPQYPPDSEQLEVKRTNGSLLLVRYAWRHQPCNGGRFLLLMCWRCARLRRMLYAWEAGGQYTNSAQVSDWQCRSCAGLRYASEGGALVHRGRGAIARLFEAYDGPLRSDRPEPWYPYVFTSPAEAAAAGLCTCLS
jgi:hypothetical protein